MDQVIYYGFESLELIGAYRTSPAPVAWDAAECYLILNDYNAEAEWHYL